MCPCEWHAPGRRLVPGRLAILAAGFLLLRRPFFAAHCPLPGFGLFDVEQFLTVYNYWYYPSGLTQFVAAYVECGIAFALAVHHSWLRARGWLRGRLGLAAPAWLQRPSA